MRRDNEQKSLANCTMHTKRSFIAFLLLCTLLAACRNVGSKRLDDAITALRKVASAVEVGVNNDQYSTLVVEAKAKVDLANDTLSEGEIKTLLNAIIDNYGDAGRAWARKIEGRQLLQVRDSEDNVLIEKYSLPIGEKTLIGDNDRPFKRTGIAIDDALHHIWFVAKENLNKLIAASKTRHAGS